jgi:hypothetical protein
LPVAALTLGGAPLLCGESAPQRRHPASVPPHFIRWRGDLGMAEVTAVPGTNDLLDLAEERFLSRFEEEEEGWGSGEEAGWEEEEEEWEEEEDDDWDDDDDDEDEWEEDEDEWEETEEEEDF